MNYLGISHKELEIPKELISRAEKMVGNLDEHVAHITDTEERDMVKHSLQKGLEGVLALKELDKPTLGDLCDMSPTMDRLMGF